jgi:hypothetical protein
MAEVMPYGMPGTVAKTSLDGRLCPHARGNVTGMAFIAYNPGDPSPVNRVCPGLSGSSLRSYRNFPQLLPTPDIYYARIDD